MVNNAGLSGNPVVRTINLLNGADKNCDGVLSKQEYVEFHMKNNGVSAKVAEDAWKSVDTNKNGTATFGEIAAAFEKRIAWETKQGIQHS